MNKLCLVDGSSYLYRAFHALPPLTNQEGLPTGAVYGVINMLKQLIKDENPDYFAVVFDPPGKTFRHDIYPEYKANRDSMPDDLKVQVKPLHQLIHALGYPLVCVDHVEADDVIGTLATMAKKLNFEVVISTSDKDLSQLVSTDVTLVNTMTKKQLNPPGVEDKFGVKPSQIIDFLALCGDTSDNIPGIPGCGPKTAVKWLSAYQTIEQLLAHKDEIGGKIGERLREHADKLPLYQDLVRIKTDVKPVPDITSLTLKEQCINELQTLYSQLNFKRWLTDIDNQQPKDDINYTLALSHESIENFIENTQKAKRFAFDIETTGLNALHDQLVGIALACPTQTIYIPINHTRLKEQQKQLDMDTVLSLMKTIFNDSSLTLIGQNLKFDLSFMKRYGLDCQCQILDTMLMSYIYHSTAGRHDLDSLAMRYLSHSMTTYDSITKQGNKRIPFSEVDIDIAAAYAAEDAHITLALADKLKPLLDDKSIQVLHQIDLPLIPVLMQMEQYGVLIDADKLSTINQAITKELNQLELAIFEETGQTFNLNSPKQLQSILFDTLGLPVIQKTPSGQPSTGEDTLQALALHYDIPKKILRFRSLSKLKSTYLEALPKQIDPQTKRIHCSYNQAITATGRLSSSNPNLQNIPIRTQEGRQVRQAFIAKPGFKLIAADYSQIELRILAHLSKDPKLCQAFESKQDIHKTTAAELFGLDINQVGPEQRRVAKTINFGLIYGMSAFGLSKSLGIDRALANDYIQRYFKRYPGVQTYMEATRILAHEQGYVETIFGRKVYLDGIKTAKHQQRQALERQAINAPMQGSNADLIKIAMIRIQQAIKREQWPCHMIMQVHDELVFEVEASMVESLMPLIKTMMEDQDIIDIPLVVNILSGDDWDTAH